MTFCFQVAEPLAEGIRRIGVEQIDRAVRSLTASPNPHAGIHDVRKSFKRLRSLLHMIRPAIGGKVFREENERIRSVARGFAGQRDAQAMIEAAAKLQDACARQEDQRLADAVAAWLRSQPGPGGTGENARHMAQALARLSQCRHVFHSLEVTASSFDAFAAGLELCYRKARTAMACAFAVRSGEDFHIWRKHVQRHWRHMQLISAAWPAALDARVKLARDLSQVLGDDHDLVMLSTLPGNNSAILDGKKQARRFLKLCRVRQSELREQARVQGARLFAEKPKAFRHRLSVYWDTAKQMEAIDPEPGRKRKKPPALRLVS